MTDYTPTTEEVRNALARITPANDHSVRTAEFDRWYIAERKRIAKMAQERLFSKLTRVTLVDDDRGGIQYERYDIQVEPSIQDDGRTLKLFISENSEGIK